MRLALIGDILTTGNLSEMYSAEDLGAIRDLLDPADLVIGNLESVMTDGPAVPAAYSGGTWMRCPTAVAPELAGLGIGVVSVANNHSLDFGSVGLRSTLRALRGAGVTAVGAGRGPESATGSRLRTVSGLRVAVLAVTTTFTPGAWAAASRDGYPARLGIGTIRHSTWFSLPRDTFREFKRASDVLGRRSNASRIRLGGFLFEEGDEFRQFSAPEETDVRRMEAQIERSRRSADIVVVSVHSQEIENRDGMAPPGFLVEIGRRALAAGAHVVFGHGTHFKRPHMTTSTGVVFYGLGDFVGTTALVDGQPADAYAAAGLTEDATIADLLRMKKGSSMPSAGPSALALLDIADDGVRGGQLTYIEITERGVPRAVSTVGL